MHIIQSKTWIGAWGFLLGACAMFLAQKFSKTKEKAETDQAQTPSFDSFLNGDLKNTQV